MMENTSQKKRPTSRHLLNTQRKGVAPLRHGEIVKDQDQDRTKREENDGKGRERLMRRVSAKTECERLRNEDSSPPHCKEYMAIAARHGER
jgi:hypothetical protein